MSWSQVIKAIEEPWGHPEPGQDRPPPAPLSLLRLCFSGAGSCPPPGEELAPARPRGKLQSSLTSPSCASHAYLEVGRSQGRRRLGHKLPLVACVLIDPGGRWGGGDGRREGEQSPPRKRKMLLEAGRPESQHRGNSDRRHLPRVSIVLTCSWLPAPLHGRDCPPHTPRVGGTVCTSIYRRAAEAQRGYCAALGHTAQSGRTSV